MATKNIVPRANNEGEIGTSTKKWNEVNATTVTADNITTALATKVDEVSGKGLSTNDLTDALKTNYDAAYAQSHSNSNDPTADQKAALAGSSGTPSGTNKYVTNDDSRNSDARTPTAHNQGADTINSGTLDGDRLPAISTAKKGAVPATGTPSGKYLKDDGTWATVEAVVADESITNAKLAHIATAIIKGRVTAATGDVEDLSAANVRTIINVEEGSTKYPDTGEQAFLDADHTKLDGIEAAADVTDAVNVAAAVHGVAAKSPLVDNDEIPIIDSAASNVLKKSLWSVVKSTLKTYFDTLYNLYVHPNHSGDVTSVADGAQTIATGAVTLAKMADMATASLIYRKTAGAGAPEVNSLATLKTDLEIPNDFDDLTDGTTNKAFTATEKTKLSGIADGAEVNVNADWNASSGDAQILNKPSTMAPSSHNNSAHSETYITVSAVTDANLSTTDVITNDVSTSKHGFCPKAPNDTAKFFRGDGTWNTPSGGSAAQILHCQDQKTAPADGGSSVAGIQTRVLNTVVLNEISGASLASNQITLPAGTYEVYAFGPTYAAGTTQAGIYNTTDSVYALMGTNSYDIAGAFVQGKFTIAAQKVIELRQFTQTARSGNGLGVSANSGIGKEVFGNIMIRKV